MLHITLCDDNDVERAFLKSLVLSFGEQRGLSLSLGEFSSAEAFLFSYGELRPDIVLLDIEMPGLSGVELAKKIRQEDKLTQIVFVTAYSEYLAEGYDVAALHYLLKPVNREKLFSVLDRAMEKIRDDGKRLLLETPEETVLLPIYRISHVEVFKNYTTVHAGKSYTLKKPLKELEDELDGRFFRVGRSCLVNLDFITRVTKASLFLKDGETIPLPRGGYEKVNRAIIGLKK